jgi:hypothetical protein
MPAIVKRVAKFFRDIGWGMALLGAVMVLNSLVVACGFIVMGERLRAKNHPENPKPLNQPTSYRN